MSTYFLLLLTLSGTVEVVQHRESFSSNTTALAFPRDASSCASEKANIQSTINEITAARLAIDALGTFVAIEGYIVPELIAGTASAGFILPAGAVLALVGGVAAACASLNNCPGLPPALVAALQGALKYPTTKNGLALLKAIGVEAEWLQNNLGSQTGLAAAGVLGAAVEAMLANAQASYTNALACCGNDCSSAVCNQAAAGCLKEWGSALFTPAGANCGSQ